MSTDQQVQWLRNRVRHVAEQMRRDAETRKYVNPSHLCGYADDLEQALADAKAGEPRTVTVPVVDAKDVLKPIKVEPSTYFGIAPRDLMERAGMKDGDTLDGLQFFGVDLGKHGDDRKVTATILPDWLSIEGSDVLVIHGRRYSAAIFGEAGFLSPPGTLLRVEAGPDDVVTLSTADSIYIVDAIAHALDEWLGPLSAEDTDRACDAIRRVLVERAQGGKP